MKPHKHAELIKAWADGAEIEWVYATQGDGTKLWAAIPHPVWYESHEYRIKPEPKPDVYEFYYAKQYLQGGIRLAPEQDSNLKVVWDGETGELKSAEVLE